MFMADASNLVSTSVHFDLKRVEKFSGGGMGGIWAAFPRPSNQPCSTKKRVQLGPRVYWGGTDVGAVGGGSGGKAAAIAAARKAAAHATE